MNTKARSFARKALWMLPVWAAMLFVSTLTHQPDPQTEFASFALYVTTREFLISHLLNSIVGAALGSIGVIALMIYLQDTRAAGKAITGMVAAVLANTLNTAAFGAAAFVQPALGQAFLSGQENALDIYNRVYSAPLFATVILGLLLFIVAGVFSGMAISASGRFPRWAGWLYTAAMIALAVSVFTVPSVQSVINAVLFAAALTVAWSANRDGTKQFARAEISSEA